MRKLEVQLHTLLQTWQGKQLKNITSVPGLGRRAAASLIVYTDGFKKISHYRHLIALAGLALGEHSSGTSIRGKKRYLQNG